MNKDPYYDVRAISNSSLNYFDPLKGGNPRYYKRYLDGNLESEDSPSLRLGTMIHMAILEPELIEIECSKVPGPKARVVIDKLFEEMTIAEVTDFSADNLALALEMYSHVIPDDYYSSRTTESKINTLVKEGAEYWAFMVVNRDKTIVDPATYAQIMGCRDSLMAHPIAKKLLNDMYLSSHEKSENELAIFYDTTVSLSLNDANDFDAAVKLPLKCKLDRVIFDHTKKTMKLVDLKTTRSGLGKFAETIGKHDYDRQMAFYTAALLEQYPDYSLDGVYIVAVQTNKEYPVEVFRISPNMLLEGQERVNALLEELAYHWHTNTWDWSQQTDRNLIVLLDSRDDAPVHEPYV